MLRLNIVLGISPNVFAVQFGAKDIFMPVVFGIESARPETYKGAYTVDPDFTTQTLATKYKRMQDDVTVNAIEVQRVSNAAGGRTVYIGGLIDG